MKVKKRIRQEYHILTEKIYNTIIYKTQNKCQMWADANQVSMTAYL